MRMFQCRSQIAADSAVWAEDHDDHYDREGVNGVEDDNGADHA